MTSSIRNLSQIKDEDFSDEDNDVVLDDVKPHPAPPANPDVILPPQDLEAAIAQAKTELAQMRIQNANSLAKLNQEVVVLQATNLQLFNTHQYQRAYDNKLLAGIFTQLSSEKHHKFMDTLQYLSDLDGAAASMSQGLFELAGIGKKMPDSK